MPYCTKSGKFYYENEKCNCAECKRPTMSKTLFFPSGVFITVFDPFEPKDDSGRPDPGICPRCGEKRFYNNNNHIVCYSRKCRPG